MGSCSTTEAAHTDKMGKGQNEGEGGFSEEQIQMYKDCFKLMDVNKDGTLDKNDLRGAFDNIGVLMSESELDDFMGEVGGPCTVQGMINMVKTKEVASLFVAVKEEEKKEEKKEEVVEAAPAEEEDGDAKKKKKKKKKAAK